MAEMVQDKESGNKVDPELIGKWEKIQDRMRHDVKAHDSPEWASLLHDDADDSGTSLEKVVKLVAGLDISYPKEAHDKDESDAYAAVVICSFPSMEVVYEKVHESHLNVPYAPGFLAFKEFPALSNLLTEVMTEKPELKPDVILVDGNGLLHPQRCGVACHIGLHFNIPTIGVAKNLHMVEGIECPKDSRQTQKKVGDFISLRDQENSVIGIALKTAKDALNPVYVSVGHNISLETARQIVLRCCKYRVPEPLRFADHISREFIRKLTTENKTNTI